MTIAAVSDVTEMQAPARGTPVSPITPEAPNPQPFDADTVTLSGSAQAAQIDAAVTPTQATAEATKDDPQTRRVFTREAAAKAAYEFVASFN